jgi:branched-chain amino acid aminotransferase
VLFAWERHWARLQRDARRMHVPMPASPDEVLASLHRLVDANGAPDCTLRIAIVRNHGGMFEAPGQTRSFDIVAFTTGLRDWGTSVRLALKPDARHGANEFRGAKITAWSQNLTWYEEARERGYDEVLLLDEHGRVSECTSANIFAAFGDQVMTPPLDSGCLPGITREVLLTAIDEPSIRISEQHLVPADLEAADQVFITSTTRDLLAVAEIEGLPLRHAASGPQERLREAFRAFTSAYVSERLSVRR